MRILFLAALAGCTAVQGDRRPTVADPGARAPTVEFSSAFEGYRPFAEQELQDWRKANEEVGAAGGHAGHPSRPWKPEPAK